MIVIAIAAGLLDLLHPLDRNAAAMAHINVKITDDCFIEPHCTMSCVSSAIRDSAAPSRLNPTGNLFSRVSSLCVASGDRDTNPQKKANWLNNKMGWQCQRASLISKNTKRFASSQARFNSRQPKILLG
jgi:hypothetical protein